MRALAHLPVAVQTAMKQENVIRHISSQFIDAIHILFLGRGTFYPAAIEGSLKMKELSYIHAEGYAAGEMKHGPIALIDDSMPVVAIALRSDSYDKTASNIEEVKARGGRVIGILTEGDQRLASLCDFVISVPEVHDSVAAVAAAIPLQLFAYHMSDLKGLDVDQPRNLAKSVTVE